MRLTNAERRPNAEVLGTASHHPARRVDSWMGCFGVTHAPPRRRSLNTEQTRSGGSDRVVCFALRSGARPGIDWVCFLAGLRPVPRHAPRRIHAIHVIHGRATRLARRLAEQGTPKTSLARTALGPRSARSLKSAAPAALCGFCVGNPIPSQLANAQPLMRSGCRCLRVTPSLRVPIQCAGLVGPRPLDISKRHREAERTPEFRKNRKEGRGSSRSSLVARGSHPSSESRLRFPVASASICAIRIATPSRGLSIGVNSFENGFSITASFTRCSQWTFQNKRTTMLPWRKRI